MHFLDELALTDRLGALGAAAYRRLWRRRRTRALLMLHQRQAR